MKIATGEKSFTNHERECRGKAQAMEILDTGTALCCSGREGFICSG